MQMRERNALLLKSGKQMGVNYMKMEERDRQIREDAREEG